MPARIVSLILAVAMLLGPLGCVSTPESGRKALIVTSDSQEVALGEKAYREMLAKQAVDTNPAHVAILSRVGERIARATGKSYDWEFHVTESADLNAFALPGGKVAVTSAMMRFVENEGELAAIVGHEAAHATARHAGQRITMALGAELGFAALAALLDGGDGAQKRLLMQALGAGAMVGAILPFNRAHEAEADAIGLVYQARAGYWPGAAVSFWQKFSRVSPPVPAFLSTHPSTENRMARVTALVSEVMPEYRASPQYGVGERLVAE